MKFTKRCTKCESEDILRLRVNYGDNAGGNAVLINAFKVVPITRYLCGHCGFIEDWVDDPQHIETIKEAERKRTK